VLSLNSYAVEHGTAEQGYLRAVDFVQKAGWKLYNLSRSCSLDRSQAVDYHPSLSARIQIALSQQNADIPKDYYGVATNFAESIRELESTPGVGFLLHSLNTSGVRQKQSKESWEALAWVLSDLLYSGDMYQDLHRLVMEGVFELDQTDPAGYGKYWCEANKKRDAENQSKQDHRLTSLPLTAMSPGRPDTVVEQ
jgi:hypothetical protein